MFRRTFNNTVSIAEDIKH